jgi:quinol monooxygenase YgiN
VRVALTEHIRLTRKEIGCLSFDVTETDPGEFRVREQFADQAAFDAHQSRTKSSTWFQVTQGMPREYQITEE